MNIKSREIPKAVKARLMLLSVGRIWKTAGTGGGGGVWVVNRLNIEPEVDYWVELLVELDSRSLLDKGLNLPKLKPEPRFC